MKKKGFTLVELLAVIVIMGIVFGLIITNVIRIADKSAIKEYDAIADIMELATKVYIEKIQPSELDIIGGTLCVTLRNLRDEGLIVLPLVDPRDDSTFDETTCISVERTGEDTYDIQFN